MRLSAAQRLLIPRYVRRGFGSAPPAGASKLLLSTPPANSYANGVAGAGAIIQLAAANGSPVLLAGVIITAFPVGAFTLAGAPALADATDAAGQAVWTGFTLSGTAGTVAIDFRAPGYTTVTAIPITLTAGAAAAATSTANVPGGTAGQPCTISVQLRDASGNLLGVAAPGTSPVTVQVGGTNPQAALAAIYNGNGTYRFTYTPANAGTDTLTIKLNGTEISGSPYTNTIQPPISSGQFNGATSLRVGFASTDSSLVGTGPEVLTASNADGSGPSPVWSQNEPIYRLLQCHFSVSEFGAQIDEMNSKDIVLMLNQVGSPNNYGEGTCYNEAEWRRLTRQWLPTSGPDSSPDGTMSPTVYVNKFKPALASRRVIIYVVDEPWQSTWHSTLWPWYVKRMGEYVKTLWPDCLVVMRVEPEYLELRSGSGNTGKGWGASSNNLGAVGYSAPLNISGNIQPDGINATRLPAGYFAKTDYSYMTWRGFTRNPCSTHGFSTILDCVRWGYRVNKQCGLGTVFGSNWVNLNDKADIWKAFNDTRDGRIHGNKSATGQAGVPMPASEVTTDDVWSESPGRLRALLDACLDPEFADSPGLSMWLHSFNNQPLCKVIYNGHLTRSDYEAGLTGMLNAANARTTSFNWRTPL